VSSMEAIQMAVVPALQVELPMASTMASNPDPSVCVGGEEGSARRLTWIQLWGRTLEA
jgi:hypothetical protein